MERRLNRGPTLLFSSNVGPRIKGVVTAGGMTKENKVWATSCRGEEAIAPAEDLFVATLSAPDHYRAGGALAVSGTSWSALIVAGIAARLLEMNLDREKSKRFSLRRPRHRGDGPSRDRSSRRSRASRKSCFFFSNRGSFAM